MGGVKQDHGSWCVSVPGRRHPGSPLQGDRLFSSDKDQTQVSWVFDLLFPVHLRDGVKAIQGDHCHSSDLESALWSHTPVVMHMLKFTTSEARLAV